MACGCRHPVFGDPGAAARFALRDQDVAATAALIAAAAAHRYLPNFLIPKPPRGQAQIHFDDQLAGVEQTPEDQVKVQLRDSWAAAAGMHRRLMHVENIARLAADGLMKFWRASLLEQWPPLEREVTGQVDACGARLAAGGVEALFASLGPAIHWTGTRLLVRKPHESHVHMENQELVVIPSRLTPHRLIAQVDGFLGIASVDSLSMDAHKWPYQPWIEASCCTGTRQRHGGRSPSPTTTPPR